MKKQNSKPSKSTKKSAERILIPFDKEAIIRVFELLNHRKIKADISELIAATTGAGLWAIEKGKLSAKDMAALGHYSNVLSKIQKHFS